MNEISRPTCPLSLAVNAVKTVSDAWDVESVEIFQHESGRFYVTGDVHFIRSFWPFDPDRCEHRLVWPQYRRGDEVLCRNCYGYVPVEPAT